MNMMPVEDRYHYQVIKRAIDVIDAAGGAPVSLDHLAAEMSMSPAHFQKVFSQWAGVSPKRYQQYLTLDHAKSLLRDRYSVLDAAHEVGLSSGGRLHDLFLRWEAMSPGDYGTGGAGLVIYWDWVETHFGEALAMATDRGLCGLAFTSEFGRDATWSDMVARWPAADYRQNSAAVAKPMDAALGGGGEIALHMIGAPFQIKVWEALLSIPSGHVTTYSEIAGAIGNPKAVRAVGTAVGRNPVSWLIPCHRALRKSGALGGYHWGLPVKRALLAWEGARADVAAE